MQQNDQLWLHNVQGTFKLHTGYLFKLIASERFGLAFKGQILRHCSFRKDKPIFMIAAFLKTFCDNTWILWRKAPRLPKIKAASLLWDVVQSLNLQIFSNSQSTSCTLVKKLFCCTVACRNDVGWKKFLRM